MFYIMDHIAIVSHPRDVLNIYRSHTVVAMLFR